MAEPEPVPGIFQLNYLDVKLYQHPPCMFLLWYLTLGLQALWEQIKDLISGEGGSPPPEEPPPPEEEPE